MNADHGSPWDDAALGRLFLEPPPVSGAEPDCPPADRLRNAASALLSAAEREGILAHVAICPACAVAWRVVAGPAPAPAGARSWRPLGAVAAVLALFAVGGLALRHGRAPADPAAGDLRRSIPAGATIESLLGRDDVVVARDACVLRWTPLPGATYDVALFDQHLAPVFGAGDLSLAEAAVPEAALAGKMAGEPLLWQVTARLPDGSRVRSAIFRIALR